MTDKEKIVALAYDMGTLKKVRGNQVYISDLLLRFDSSGNISSIREKVPGRELQREWREVK